MEKLNDDCRKIHLYRSNKWDASKDILLVEKRLDRLSENERTARSYQKQKRDYWETHIKESRSKRHRVSLEAASDSSTEKTPLNSLTNEQVKGKLKELGVRTKLKSRRKLEDLLTDTLYEKENVLLD